MADQNSVVSIHLGVAWPLLYNLKLMRQYALVMLQNLKQKFSNI